MPGQLTSTATTVTLTANSSDLANSGFLVKVIVTREVTDSEIGSTDLKIFLQNINGRIEGTALIDTGADLSAVRTDYAPVLGKATDMHNIIGVDGTSHPRASTRATVWLPNLIRRNIELIWADAANVDILLGRDFLQGFIMTYNGSTGTATLSKP